MSITTENVLSKFAIHSKISYEDVKKKYQIDKGDWVIIPRFSLGWEILTSSFENEDSYEVRSFGDRRVSKLTPFRYLNEETNILKTQEEKNLLKEEMVRSYYLFINHATCNQQ